MAVSTGSSILWTGEPSLIIFPWVKTVLQACQLLWNFSNLLCKLRMGHGIFFWNTGCYTEICHNFFFFHKYIAISPKLLMRVSMGHQHHKLSNLFLWNISLKHILYMVLVVQHRLGSWAMSTYTHKHLTPSIKFRMKSLMICHQNSLYKNKDILSMFMSVSPLPVLRIYGPLTWSSLCLQMA